MLITFITHLLVLQVTRKNLSSFFRTFLTASIIELKKLDFDVKIENNKEKVQLYLHASLQNLACKQILPPMLQKMNKLSNSQTHCWTNKKIS